jgi:hypothetical protein
MPLKPEQSTQLLFNAGAGCHGSIWHCHVGNFYLSSSQFAIGSPSQNQPVAPRPTEAKWPRNRLYSANVTMPVKAIVTVLCDLRTRYASKLFNLELLRGQNLLRPAWLQKAGRIDPGFV